MVTKYTELQTYKMILTINDNNGITKMVLILYDLYLNTNFITGQHNVI